MSQVDFKPHVADYNPDQKPIIQQVPYSLQQPSRAGKVPKPIMEKRRRARINKCLEELKVLVPDLTESGTRVDKADVLEMTVEHLTRMRNKRRNLTSNLSSHPTPYVNPHMQFTQGYQQCMSEVTKLLLSSPVDEGVTHKLVEHLSKRNRVLSSHATSLSPAPQHTTPVPLPQHTPVSLPQHTPVSGISSPLRLHNTTSPVVPEPIKPKAAPFYNFSPASYSTQQLPQYPSPPSSPVDSSQSSPISSLLPRSPISSLPDRINLLSLPSVARRPQRPVPQLWRPW